VRLLLRAGAKPNVANRYGVTPLSLAAVNGNPVMLETLLKAGADVKQPLPMGETVIMRAARTGSPEALKVLVAHGADVNKAEDSLGETALMWAAAENNAQAVAMLLEVGANANAKSRLTTFPKTNPARTANALVSVVMPRGGWTPLMHAARRGAAEAPRHWSRAVRTSTPWTPTAPTRSSRRSSTDTTTRRRCSSRRAPT
jgi:ankyrin repeat protein